MQAKFCTQINIGEGSVGGDLDKMVAQCVEWHGEVRMIGFEVVELWDVYQEVLLYVFILRGPDPFAAFVDNGVLVWVVIGSGAGWGSEKVGEKVGFWKDREAKGVTRGSRWGGRRDSGDRGGNNGRQKVLDWDVSKRDTLDDFFETLVDICILRLRVGVFKLRTREIVLLSGDVGENLKEVGRGGNKDGQGGGDGNDGRRIDDKRGEEGGRADGRVREDRDGEAASGVAIRAWIVPGVVRAIEEVLNNLVGSGNVYLVDIINLQPRGNRKGGGGDGSGGDGSDKRRRHLNTFN